MCDDCSQRHTLNLHPQAEHKRQTGGNVHHVLHDGDKHRNTSVLHPDKPAVQTVDAHHGRCPPDADIEIGGCQRQDVCCRVHQQQGKLANGDLQDDETERDADSHSQRADKQAHHLRHVAAAKRLRGHTAGAHTQKTKQPVEQVENHRPHGNGSDIGGAAHVADNSHVNQPKQRYGDIRYDAGQGYLQDLFVALVHNRMQRYNEPIELQKEKGVFIPPFFIKYLQLSQKYEKK